MRGILGGAAVSALFAGIVAAYSKNCGLAAAMFLLASLTFLAAVANRVRGLHRLPLVGAARWPAVTFHVEPTKGMTVQFEPGTPRDVIVCAQLTNAQNDEIRRVFINVWVDGASAIVRCEQDGGDYAGGGRMKVSDSPYWSEADLVLWPDVNEFCFRATIPGPGEYEVVFRFNSPEFYGKTDRFKRDVLIVEATNCT